MPLVPGQAGGPAQRLEAVVIAAGHKAGQRGLGDVRAARGKRKSGCACGCSWSAFVRPASQASTQQVLGRWPVKPQTCTAKAWPCELVLVL